jgi:hypothetical protein
MKKVISIIAVLILVGLGAYYMRANTVAPETVEEMPDVQEQVETPVAVPTTPTTPVQVQGKINIDEVCQGALIRMTFTDGAAADQFVAECKEGKHPEVIEQFKADMNLGTGAEI